MSSLPSPAPGATPAFLPAQRPALRLDLWEPFTTALARAAARGDPVAVTQALSEGADPNRRGLRGMTALHHAAYRGHAEVAALLLAHGADPELRDRRGRAALEPPHIALDVLHRIRQYHHRRRRMPMTWTDPPTDAARALAGTLSRDGIVHLPGFVPAGALAELRADFSRFIADLEARLARGDGKHRHYDEEEHFWERELAFVCNNAFKYSAALARLASHPTLLDGAGLYLGARPYLQRAVAMRYLPCEALTSDMFGWHHDLEEKRFKIMVLLTDVPAGGQHMSYVLGSHAAMHPREMFLRNACPLDYCASYLPEIRIFEAIGKAGDLFIFDSNGAHRGNRRPEGPLRDVLMLEYTADGSHIWGGDLPAAFVTELPAGDHPFRRLQTAEKAWEKTVKRKTSSWLGNLPDWSRWI